MNSIRIIFFGSFQTFSVQVLEVLRHHFDIVAVVTTPPKPKGRHMEVTPTDVALYAQKAKLPLFELADLSRIPQEIPKPDFVVVAGFGERIPPVWLKFARTAPINMHPSLVPYYRGAFPAEWAILRGEKKTGVTIIRMNELFDQGDIMAQEEVSIATYDTRQTLYEKLYQAGADLIIKTLPRIARGDVSARPQPSGNYFYARRLIRDDGFIPWKFIQAAINSVDVPQPERPGIFSSVTGNWSMVIERSIRALSGWPGVWTVTPAGKRLKMLSLKPEPIVQLEGKTPIPFKQFQASSL